MNPFNTNILKKVRRRTIIKFGSPIVELQERQKIMEVLDSGIFVHGSKTTEFEDQFSGSFGYKNSVSVASCTAGLHLAHHCLSRSYLEKKTIDVPEVLCPAMTHVATSHAIELCGLRPVFVDCELETGNSSCEQFEEKISNKTIGIAPMHFNGVPCEINEISALAKEKNLYLVEDCAISLGSTKNSQPVGTFGDCGVFSFHPVKQMTTGEGGMIVTDNDVFANKLQYTRAFGVDRNFNERKIPGQYEVPFLGFNYRMAEIPAAMGISQLQKVKKFQASRKNNYIALENNLKHLEKIKIMGCSDIIGRTFYTLIILLKDSRLNRDLIIKKMLDEGVQTSIYYPSPVPRFLFYQKKYEYDSKDFPNATSISDRSIALPIGPHLGLTEMKTISKSLKKVLENGK